MTFGKAVAKWKKCCNQIMSSSPSMSISKLLLRKYELFHRCIGGNGLLDMLKNVKSFYELLETIKDTVEITD